MKDKRTPIGFWEGEHCEYCGGALVEKTVTVYRTAKHKHALIENVPAGVCTQCGTRYFAANVLKMMEESVRGRRKADREERVLVYSL